MFGFLNLNKPTGMTSHDCIARLRKILNLRRIGHGGTLDPLADGVLPIALGPCTRLIQFLPGEKIYRGRVRLGVVTATDDLGGETIATTPAGHVQLGDVEAALAQFQGVINQRPPVYSAIQIQGQRLYDLARSGRVVEAPVRAVEVYRIEVLDWSAGDFPEVELAIHCGSGTYIRAIARDLGVVLGVGGTLAALTRTQSAGFSLADSWSFEQLAKGEGQFLEPGSVLGYLGRVDLPMEVAKRWCQGQKIGEVMVKSSGEFCCVYAEDGKFLGIGQIVDTSLIPKVVMAGE